MVDRQSKNWLIAERTKIGFDRATIGVIINPLTYLPEASVG